MTEWMLYLSDIITGILRVMICLFLIYKLLKTQKPDKKCVLAAAAGEAAIAACFLFLPLSCFWDAVLEGIWIAVCASRFRKAGIRMCLFISIFYEIGIQLWIFLLSAGMGILFQSAAFLDSASLPGQAAVWLLHILLIGLTAYTVKHPDLSGKSALRIFSMIVLAGFIAVISLTEQTVLAIPEDTLSMWTILAVVLMMSILVFNINRQYESEKEVARLKSEQAALLERDYTALNNAYAVNARLFHDFHNHMGALRQMLLHDKYEEAITYLEELQEPVREIADTVWTGDETVDYLINSKASAAASRQIQLKPHVEFPRNTNIRSADLCAILGNFLDNALEAAEKVPDPERRVIYLTIRRINQMLVIKAENYFTVMPQMENGSLRSTKTESGLHGWGLKSAQTAAEKYDGMVKTTCEANIFRAVATLSYHGISKE